jgi:hypothetical protein
MDPTTCQALCAVIVQNGDQVGVLLAELALGLYAAVTTALAFVGRIKLRRANKQAEAEAERAKAAERERAAVATERDAVTIERDYWREQSMRPFPRPPLLPVELGAHAAVLEGIAEPSGRMDEPPGRIAGECGATRHEPSEARLVCTRPLGHEGLHDSDGYQWRDVDEDGTRYAELPGRPADRPMQFDETPTGRGKRKPE